MGAQLLLSNQGSDRATAYPMSAKVVRRRGQYLCTWLDRAMQNHWALVAPDGPRIVQSGPVGPPRKDNHCGAAVCAEPDGTIHCLVGAHHGTFLHYELPADAEPGCWRSVGGEIGRGATYPSVLTDSDGTLHLAYRCRELTPGAPYPYHLMYARRRKNGVWEEPRPLVRVSVLEHTWLTNAIAAGPKGHLHLVLSNTRRREDGSYYFGASHLFSPDGGDSWRQLSGDAPLALPAEAARLDRIEGPDLPPDRILSAERAKQPWYGPGNYCRPWNYYYHEILLSNPMADDAGRPWVVLHNLLRGTADLYRGEDGGWRSTPLLPAVKKALPGHLIAHAGQLSRHADGAVEVVLTVVSEEGAQQGFGAPGTRLVRLLADANGAVSRAEMVFPSDEKVPQWHPSIERRTWHDAPRRPALLFTRGYNSGKCLNDLTTEVFLNLP